MFQCAAVNFVSGINSTVSSSCTNVTGLTATVTNQNNFSEPSSSSGSTPSPTSSGAASTSSAAGGNGAAANAPQLITGLFGAVALVASFLL
jgi:hypothetical protein